MINSAEPLTIVLASSSAQRKTLLQQIGIEPLCVAADIDETRRNHEAAAEYVERLAIEKCQSVLARYPDAIVIGADTTISKGAQVLGKASNFQQAQETLSLLSDAAHSVMTGVCVATASGQRQLVCETVVEFGPLSAADISAYWQSGEPQGKAGCYAIQGIGAIFVTAIHGSYSNVVGLPVREVSGLLRHFGVEVLS